MARLATLALAALAAFASVASVARAERPRDPLLTLADSLLAGVTGPTPKLMIMHGRFIENATDTTMLGGPDVGDDLKTVVANSADGKAAWVAIDLGGPMMCGMGDCAKLWKEARAKAYSHVTLLFDAGQPVFVHDAATITDAEVAKASGAVLADVPAGIDKDAQPVVDLFTASMTDPKVFAATVSDRKDVVLYGSDPGERIVGGAAVRATWLKWGLALAAHGGVHAGVTSSKTVAWLVTTVDARAKTDKKATPYTVSAIYEKQGDAWSSSSRTSRSTEEPSRACTSRPSRSCCSASRLA